MMLRSGQKPPHVYGQERCSYVTPALGYCNALSTQLVVELNTTRNEAHYYIFCDVHARKFLEDTCRENRRMMFRGTQQHIAQGIEVIPLSWYLRDVDRVTLFDDDTEYDDDDDDDDDDWYDDYGE